MKTLRRNVLLPAIFSAGSFLCLLALAMLTSPVSQIAYAVAFFILLLIFMVSLGYVVTTIQVGKVSPKSRGRILSLSIFVLLLLMFRSAGSLTLVGGIVLILIIAGMLFYGSHRAKE